MLLQPGQRIRDYEIIRLLGEGGMGEVWLAKEILLDRFVAIKLLNPELTREAHFVERFTNEARIQAQLVHTNIVQLITFFNENNTHFMVMEYAAGITLKEFIQKTGPIPEARTLRIFQQMVAALGYAHSRNIIHRDVKPSNIMIDPANGDQVKVMDFGIARLMTDMRLTRTGTRMGTLYYMSPEQVMAQKDIDHRSDIYSLGVVLYEMLSGRIPFDVNTESDYVIQKAIMESPLPDPRQYYGAISQKTVNLLESLTQKDRNKRPDNILLVLENDKGDIEKITDEESHPPIEETRIEVNADEQEKDEPYPVTADEDLDEDNRRAKKKINIILSFLSVLFFLLFTVVLSIAIAESSKEPEPEEPEEQALAPVLIQVEGGYFYMGSDVYDDGPIHEVTVSTFWIGKYPVTQKEWEEVMGSNPSYWKGDDLPVEQVSWRDAIEYCNKRSIKEGLTPCYSGSGDNISCNWNADGYRLPTEAEWEYAARGGRKSKGYQYSGSNDIGSVAWYFDNSGGKTHAVGSKDPNELGLYDMSGNVWEWCWDWYDDSYYGKSPVKDPKGPGSRTYRVLRGGSWYSITDSCRVANRGNNYPDFRYNNFGFRVCRAIK